MLQRHGDVMSCFLLCWNSNISNFQLNRCLLQASEQKPDLVNFHFLSTLFILLINQLLQNFITSRDILSYSNNKNTCIKSIVLNYDKCILFKSQLYLKSSNFINCKINTQLYTNASNFNVFTIKLKLRFTIQMIVKLFENIQIMKFCKQFKFVYACINTKFKKVIVFDTEYTTLAAIWSVPANVVLNYR